MLLLQQFQKFFTSVTLPNELTGSDTGVAKLGAVMTSLALIRRSSTEGFLASQIRAFIAQYLKVEVDSIGAHSHLADDFGLDLLDITELLVVLEEQFAADGELTDEPNQIEFVGDLIRYIEAGKRAVES